MYWASYFDEISKLAARDRQQKAKDVTEKEVKRVARRTIKRVGTPTYDNLLRTLARGIRRSPIKVAGSPDLKRVEEKAEEAAKTVGQLAGHSEAHMLARRGIKKTLEPGYVHMLEMLARQARKIPIPKVAAAALAHQYRFQGQMNRFLKDLMRTKRGPADIFGGQSKRRLHQIYFPQSGGKP